MVLLPYIPYLCLVQFIWVIGNQVVAFSLYGNSIWKLIKIKNLSNDFSPIVRNYIYLNLIASLTSLISSFYMTIFWRPSIEYNAYIMFFTGWIENAWSPMLPATVFFITLERCLSLKFPFGVKRQQFLYIISIIICFGILVINGTFLMLEIPDSVNTGTRCGGFRPPARGHRSSRGGLSNPERNVHLSW